MPVEHVEQVATWSCTPPRTRFSRTQRLSPLGYFAMGVGYLRLASDKQSTAAALVIANGSDWTPQPVTLHRSLDDGSYESLPSWFSADYDHHMGLAVGDVTGNGFDDVVVAVFAGKNQELSGGGVKVYLGGPSGLVSAPVWLAQGFAATSVALADLCGGGRLDIVVSCMWERGTIQCPGDGTWGAGDGRARLLRNVTRDRGALEFDTHVIERGASRGCGDVTVTGDNRDGHPDVVFAGPRTAVLFGPPRLNQGPPWSDAPLWQSEESHPYSPSVRVLSHPAYPDDNLVVSSRGLCATAQLGDRSLSDVGAGIFVHCPCPGETSTALQVLAPCDAARPELPAGLAVLHDGQGHPTLVAGFLDARSRDIRGAALRTFDGDSTPGAPPFRTTEGQRLDGGGLMGVCVATAERRDGGVDIVASSGAAWPPAGASGVWRLAVDDAATTTRGAPPCHTKHSAPAM